MNFEVHNLGHPNNNNKQANKYVWQVITIRYYKELYLCIQVGAFSYDLISVCTCIFKAHLIKAKKKEYIEAHPINNNPLKYIILIFQLSVITNVFYTVSNEKEKKKLNHSHLQLDI